MFSLIHVHCAATLKWKKISWTTAIKSTYEQPVTIFSSHFHIHLLCLKGICNPAPAPNKCKRHRDVISLVIDNSLITMHFVSSQQQIPGGIIDDSRVLSGVMLNKDVTHPRMKRRIENPRIMLLDCNLEYKKGESQVGSPTHWCNCKHLFLPVSLREVYLKS